MQRIKLCCFNQCWCKFSVEPYLCINKTLICAEAYDSQVLIDLELQKLNTSSEPCLSFEFEKKKWIFHLFVDEIHLFDHASYMHFPIAILCSWSIFCLRKHTSVHTRPILRYWLLCKNEALPLNLVHHKKNLFAHASYTSAILRSWSIWSCRKLNITWQDPHRLWGRGE